MAWLYIEPSVWFLDLEDRPLTQSIAMSNNLYLLTPTVWSQQDLAILQEL